MVTKTSAVGTARSLTWEQVRAWRLHRQHLDRRVPPDHELDVVARLCGVHAQLLSSAELALWARVEGLEAGTVSRLLWDRRTLVKTWAMRGTLHLLRSDEYGLWQGALSTYAPYLKPSWLRAFGVTREELEALLAAVAEALEGRALTRDQLAGEVARATGSARLGDKLRESWGVFLKPAAFRGQLCFAPNAGANVRFTRPGGWLPENPQAVDSQVALLDVARRFLAAHGPCTRDDLARWWGTTPAQAGRLLRGLGEEAVTVDVAGAEAWMLVVHVDDLAGASLPRTVRLLPAFDQYVVGATRHAANLLPGDFAHRVYRAQGWLSPLVLVDGRMEGVWRHERKGRRLVVEIEPFVVLPAWARRAVEAEAATLANFLQAQLQLRWVA